jgi:alkylated DNA repair dioxygenase AlkB
MSVAIETVPGLLFTPELITKDEEKAILAALQTDRGHHVPQIHPAQEFGWRFLKRKNQVYPAICPVSKDDFLGPLPDWLIGLWFNCLDRTTMPKQAHSRLPDHVLVNTYLPGDGCVAHVDDPSFWDDWVVGLSLGSGCMLEFRKLTWDTPPVQLWIPPRSIYILTGDARYKYTHSIPFATSDSVDGKILPRAKRVSITFRTIQRSMLSEKVRASVCDQNKRAQTSAKRE